MKMKVDTFELESETYCKFLEFRGLNRAGGMVKMDTANKPQWYNTNFT